MAYGIVALLPPELVLNTGTGAGFAMIFALLVSAILWNVGTWYLGLPASSSHTLIGSIMGVGVADSIIGGHGWAGGINWPQAEKVGMALALSPVVGFIGAGLLLLILKAVVPRKDLFQAPPDKETPPPVWIRCLLVLTCTLVSVFHGSNDAQKGMGLMMLILVGIIPGAFAVDLALDNKVFADAKVQLQQVVTTPPDAAGRRPDAAGGRGVGRADRLHQADRRQGHAEDVRRRRDADPEHPGQGRPSRD